MLNKRYRINSPAIVHDLIDHEVVVIDFNTGSYYSFEGASAALWSMVAEESSLVEIIERFGGRNENGSSELKTAVTNFLGQLVLENLIMEESGDGSTGLTVPRPEAPIDATSFTGFRFQKFSDMNQLLLLDPIHDVTTAGWPHLPADASVTDGRQR
jgi:hypothetical protein